MSRQFIYGAGIATSGYDYAAAIVAATAELLGYTPADLKGSIWYYQRGCR